MTAAALAVAVVLPAPASGARPAVRACIADAAAPGCGALPSGSLQGVSSLAVSPDGRRVYAAAYGAGTLTAFRRAADGRLTVAGCVGGTGGGGCADVPGGPLGGASGVAVSPGGGDVYVAAGLGRSLTRFEAAADAPAFGACTADRGRFGCLAPRRDALTGASAVAVGPGGADVYVTAFDGAAVSHFRRAPDGGLRLADCVADAGAFGCVRTPDNVLEGADAVAVSPDGRQVYVTAFRSGSVVRFTRRDDGALRYAGCVADRGANGCARMPVDALVGVTGLTLDDDGRRLYTASQTGVVSTFVRGRSGGLRFAACVGREVAGRCQRLRGGSLTGATAVVARGRDLWVAAQRAGVVLRLRRRSGDRLSLRSCLAGRRVRGCGRGPAAALTGIYALAVRGGDVYAASPDGAAVSVLRLPAS